MFLARKMSAENFQRVSIDLTKLAKSIQYKMCAKYKNDFGNYLINWLKDRQVYFA